MRGRLLNLLLCLSALPSLRAHAESSPGPASVEEVKLVVTSARGKKEWGADTLTRALRGIIQPGVGELVPERPYVAAIADLRLKGPEVWNPENVARAGRAVGAHFVLITEITRSGWLHTARSLLVDTASAEIRMDFRSDFYKPRTEAADRGERIGRKTLEKLRAIVRVPGAPGATAAPTGGVAEAPLAPAITATASAPAETADLGAWGSDLGAWGSELETSGGSGEGGVFAQTGASQEYDGFDDGGWTWTIRGWLGTSHHAFLHPDLREGVDRNFAKVGLRSTLLGKLGPRARMRILPLVEADLLRQRIHRVIVEEGFLELSFEPVELRLGWDALSWGSASTVNIVDVINARDFSEGVVDAPKIGQPMAAVRVLFGNHSLSLLYLAPFIAPRLPRPGTAFNPLPYDEEPRVVLGSGLDAWQPQGAARLAFAFNKLDLRASYFFGYERFPFAHLASNTLFFPLVHHVSTDGQLIAWETTLKWEFALVLHPETSRSRTPPITLSSGLPAAAIELPGPRVNAVIGLERNFEGVIGKTRLTPVAEVVLSSDSTWFRDDRPPDDLTQFFQNHLVAGFRWSLENSADSQLTLVDLVDLSDPGNHLLTAEYQQRLLDHFSLLVSGRWVFARQGNKMASFESLSGVSTTLRLNY